MATTERPASELTIEFVWHSNSAVAAADDCLGDANAITRRAPGRGQRRDPDVAEALLSARSRQPPKQSCNRVREAPWRTISLPRLPR